MLRLLSIGMISLLLYQSAGFVLTFELGVRTIRKEVREKLIPKGEGSLVRLAFHRSSKIIFKDEGQEIYHLQNMYDILRQEVRDDSIIFTCFHDIAESKLVAAFEEEIKDITNQAQSEQQAAKWSVKKMEYLPSSHTSFMRNLAVIFPFNGMPAKHALPILCQSIPYPPPKAT